MTLGAPVVRTAASRASSDSGDAARDWSARAAADPPAAFAVAWLAWLWQRLPEPARAVVLRPDAQGRLRPIASLPTGASLDGLQEPIARAVSTAEAGMPDPTPTREPGGWAIVRAARVGDTVTAVVCAELRTASCAEASACAELVDWGLGWLGARWAAGTAVEAEAHERAKRLLALLLETLSAGSWREARLAAVNTLAAQHGASLVQLAEWRGRRMHVTARSGSGWHDGRLHLLRLAERFLSEAADDGRDRRVEADRLPPAAGDAGAIYLHEARAQAVAVVLLRSGERLVGGLLLERDTAFDTADGAELEAVAMLLGPLLESRAAGARGAWARAWETFRGGMRAIGAGAHPVATAVACVALLALAALALVPATYRVTAPSSIEGEVQRAVAVPYPGFLHEAFARAGDTVRRGQTLASLQDRDLLLEKVRWQAELEVAQRKEREAMAAGNRVEQRLAAAQANQAAAQLDLAVDRLERATIVAPFDGIVVRGDLTQQLGSPVEQGKVLFELAPLDAWRVALKVDERDIAQVRPGQRGQLALASLPGTTQAFVVRRLMAVATPEDGRTFFRVEADLAERDPLLRPGMEGVGKIDIEPRSLLRIGTQRLVDWLRLAVWEWRP